MRLSGLLANRSKELAVYGIGALRGPQSSTSSLKFRLLPAESERLSAVFDFRAREVVQTLVCGHDGDIASVKLL